MKNQKNGKKSFGGVMLSIAVSVGVLVIAFLLVLLGAWLLFLGFGDGMVGAGV